MELQFRNLINRLEGKGFVESEIALFMKEMFILLQKDMHPSIAKVNEELEELGWGIRPLDSVTFDMIKSSIGQGA